jgi:hypothetical protein
MTRWMAFDAAVCQRKGSYGQELGRHLSATLRIPFAMPCIDDLVVLSGGMRTIEFASSLSLPVMPAIVGLCIPDSENSTRDPKRLLCGYPGI